jgi:hypothetical protein
MSEEIMDDYDAGKKFAQNKALELMDEVIEQYKEQYASAIENGHFGGEFQLQAQLNAVKFMKNWVRGGGTEDENGNRVCLVR